MRILNSIVSNFLGTGNADTIKGRPGPLISVGGVKLGPHGQQIDLPSSNKIAWFEDFTGNTLPVDLVSVEGTDSATSAPSILAGGIGGVLRLTTGDAGTGFAADVEQIVTTLAWQASNGGLVFEARVKASAITTCWMFFGFTDNLAAEQPVRSATTTTFTTDASDAVGFMFDTGMTSKNWWLTGVAADVDATMQDSGIAPVAAQYQVLRIEIDAAGAAAFFINGAQVGTKMVGALTPATDLTPILSATKLSVTASMTVDVDYVHVAMDRLAPGTAT